MLLTQVLGDQEQKNEKTDMVKQSKTKLCKDALEKWKTSALSKKMPPLLVKIFDKWFFTLSRLISEVSKDFSLRRGQQHQLVI